VDFSVYQSASTVASYYKKSTVDSVVPGLTGQALELALMLYKSQDDLKGSQDQLMDELGHLLWWCARVADLIGCDMNDVAKLNIRKVASPANQYRPSNQWNNRLVS
jgi:NTP pyrophosphatase (non-canonical NTP hydrolase)